MKNLSKIFLMHAFIFASLLFANSVQASVTASLIPSTGYIQVGDVFSVDFKISASSSAVNVVDGKIKYNKDLLEIKNIEIDQSKLSLWTVPVSFDNQKGEIAFVGGAEKVLKGQNNQILKINFIAKQEGKTKIDFNDNFSVFENDGKGTRINPWLQPVEITILPSSNQNQGQDDSDSDSQGWIAVASLLLLLVVVLVAKRYVVFKK
jgi:hypothetical protein